MGRCLCLTDAAWSLVTNIFTDNLSVERCSPGGQLLISLAAEHLLPCLIRLTDHSSVYARASTTTLTTEANETDALLNKFSNAVFRRLQADRILFPTIVPSLLDRSQSVADR